MVAGGLGANPHPAQALEEFTSREDLLPTVEAILRTFDHYGNRDNKLRARMKWLVDTMGIDEVRARILKERRLLRAAFGWPGGIPAHVAEQGDAPAGITGDGAVENLPGTVPVQLLATDPYQRWVQANVVRGRANGTVSAMASCKLGDITSEQFRALAEIQRDLVLDIRITNRQNLALRDLTEADLRGLYDRLAAIGMADPGAERAAMSSRARAPTRATSPSPRAAGSPTTSGARSKRPACPTSVACASTSPAARTRAASTTSPTSASTVSSAGRTAGPRPGTRCSSAATSATCRWSSVTRP